MKSSKKQWGDHRPDIWTPEWFPPPTFGTRRRAERKTYGAAVARTAALYGTALLPAQRHVIDVTHERDPKSGLLSYHTISGLFHRQFGKTRAITWPVISTRCEAFDDQDCVYLAQDKNSAKEKWRDDFIAKLEKSDEHMKDRDYSVRWEIGSEQLKFMPSDSKLSPGAIMKQSGHGGTRDLVVVDEAWWHQDFAVDSGYRVPQVTRREVWPGAQMWIISAAGTKQRSVYFLAQIEKGRKAVAKDAGRGRAHFEWSCPEDGDIENPELWWYYIPALGHTITEATIADDLEEMDEDQWRRAYASQFTDEDEQEEEPEPKFSEAQWLKQVDAESRIDGDAVVGVAVDLDRSGASIGLTGRRPEGDWHVDFVKSSAGTSWVIESIVRMTRDFPSIRGAALDGGGPASSLIAGLERAGVNVIKLSGQGVARSCAEFADSVVEGRLWHRGQPELSEAIGLAGFRSYGRLWIWQPKHEEESVAPLEAVTVALGGAAMLAEEPEADDESPVLERGGLFKW